MFHPSLATPRLGRGLRAGAVCAGVLLSVVPAARAQDAGASAALERGDVASPLGEAAFRAAAARALDVPEADVELGRVEGPVRLDAVGLELWVASAIAGERKAVVALDAAGGAHDLGQARLADRAAAFALRGKLSPALYDRLRQDPHTPALVALWIDAEGAEDARLAAAQALSILDEAGLADEAAVDRELDALAAGVRAAVEPATSAFARELETRGFHVVQTDEYAPLVFVHVETARLGELHADPRVLEIDSAEGEFAPRLSNAYREVRADKLYSAYPTANADYARVGIVEGGAPCDGAWLDVVETRLAGGTSAHTTGVASCIASSHAIHKGVAKGAKIYGANGATFTAGSTFTSGFAGSVSAISWAIGKGCHVMNLSYGAGAPTSTVTGFDKYLDYVARTNAKTLAIACGNSGAYAGDPGAGFNQIAVGNFNDQNDYNWIGETMASSSSWQNPSTGVETPQLAAPGTGLTMLDCAGGTSYAASGTSFSSPIVAGAAALVIDRQPALGGWPEPVRAILMATAWHNVEGATKLSAKDGAGGLDAYAAYRVAARGKGTGFQYGTLTPSSFDSAGLYTAQTVYVTAGTKVRACLSWDSQVTKSEFFGLVVHGSTLSSDLDFRAYSPTGALVTSSASSIQPFEMLEFTAPTTGYYKFRIRNWSFGGSSEYYGTAVSMISDKGE